MAREMISLREFARRMDRSASYIHKLINAGKVPRVDGKIPWPEARDALESARQPEWDALREHNAGIREANRKGGPPAPRSAPVDSAPIAGGSVADVNAAFQRARASEKIYQAELRKLEFRARKGELVEKDGVVADAVDTAAEIRSLLLSVPSSVAPSCVGKSAREIEALIEDGIVRAMKALQNSAFGGGK